MSALRILAAAITFLIVFPVQARAMKLDYDIYAGGLFLVSGEMKLNLGSDHYTAGVEAKGGRLVDLLSRWSYKASADGRVENGVKVAPEEFRSFRSQRKRKRALNMDYDKDGNVAVMADPPQSELSANAVAPEFRPKTLDPVSAMVGVIAANSASGCTGTFPVFDGRRRYDVIVTSNGTDTLEKSSRNMHAGEAEKCTILLRPVAGFERDRDEEDFFRYGIDRTATAWFAKPLAGGPPVPVRIQVDLEWVSVVMNLVSATGT
jgi:Protein of unknown function (DUF3108)